jgi:hypothetical protein
MKSTKLTVLSLVLALLVAAPGNALAQDDGEMPPTIHYVTTSTFHVTYGDALTPVMEFIREVMVPANRMNPDVVSFRVAQHSFGTGGEVVLITEYASWDAINATCEPCDAAFEEWQGEEGSPQREASDAKLEAFLAEYSVHQDEMYTVNMDTDAK